MKKLIAIRVEEENARKLYDMAEREHRNPGQQLDAIMEALPEVPAEEPKNGKAGVR